ncbi:MAG: dienelactone hydrolase family protein [Phreatobacter sp.]|uniref:dienelactone hydrolase family protein n=1 Tax=Phreatobacter sp. TaxID=1966341 RepID=UPI001A588EF6|nr:dienelactone hydrolase family protein [Phreatobacter sp.]MBL8571819.1 dienelactone hydrolase family protein [Phreatobacter sp.]
MRSRPLRRPSLVPAVALLLVALAGLVPAAAEQTIRFAGHPLDAETLDQGALTAALWLPAGAGPHPAIVMMHGCGGLRRRDGALTARHRDWAERFVGLGHVVLHVDSFTPRGLSSICEQTRRSIEPERERARDAYAALAYLQSRPDVRPDAVSLLGWSHGGASALNAVGTDAPARPTGLARDFAAAIAFYPGCRAVAERRQGWTTGIPLLILVGDADDWTPVAPCRTLVDRAASYGAPVALVVYPGAVHDFDAPDMALHVRRNVGSTRSGTATLGTDPAARDDAIRRVRDFVTARTPPP